MTQENNKKILVVEDAEIAESIRQGAPSIGTEAGDVPVTAFDLVLYRAPDGAYAAIRCNFAYPENIAVAGIKDNGEGVPAAELSDEFKPNGIVYLINGQPIATTQPSDELRNAWEQALAMNGLLMVDALVTLHQGKKNESVVWERIPINPAQIAHVAMARV